MSIFSFAKKKEVKNQAGTGCGNTAELANLVLNSIEEGVIIVHPSGTILLANPAAMRMLGVNDVSAVQNVQLSSVLRLENGEGMKLDDAVNPVLMALNAGENYATRDLVLVNLIEQRRPVAINLISANAGQNERIITLRDISRELEEEGEQTEFISTASHEMRTPVASIEGYIGLALNPKTATIDERARKYLEEAQTSSKHLGRLFKDLLDVTKLDDKKIKVQLSPVEMSSTVRSIANGQVPQMSEKGIHYTFGATSTGVSGKTLNQEVYASVDIDFLREAVNNLVENAIKYTAPGGGIWVNVRGDDDRVLINVTDTGIGISPDDLKHVFQKFYRADNSQTRTVGGTGLGLYLVKQRVEAMGGKVWAESSFGEGSTFYLSFPRITAEEYQRRKQIASNIEAMSMAPTKNVTPAVNVAPTMSATPVVSTAPVTDNAPVMNTAPATDVSMTTSVNQTANINPAADVNKTTNMNPAASVNPIASVNPTTPLQPPAQSPVPEQNINFANSQNLTAQTPIQSASSQQPVTQMPMSPVPPTSQILTSSQQSTSQMSASPQQPVSQTAPITTSQTTPLVAPQTTPTITTQMPPSTTSQATPITTPQTTPATPQNQIPTQNVNNFNQVPPLNN